MEKGKAGLIDVAIKVSNQFQELNEARTKDIIKTTFMAIMELAESNPKGVHLQGIGIFRSVERKERVGRNPKTGETVTISAMRKIVFKASGTTTRLLK